MKQEQATTENDARNPACPACIEYRQHTEADWKEFHKYVRHGYTKEQGWTHPDLDKEKIG